MVFWTWLLIGLIGVGVVFAVIFFGLFVWEWFCPIKYGWEETFDEALERQRKRRLRQQAREARRLERENEV